MKTIKQSLLTIVLGLVLAAGISYVRAAPSGPPPYNNIAAPVNIGDKPQEKIDDFNVKGMFRALDKSYFGKEVGIGTEPVDDTALSVKGMFSVRTTIAPKLIVTTLPASACTGTTVVTCIFTNPSLTNSFTVTGGSLNVEYLVVGGGGAGGSKTGGGGGGGGFLEGSLDIVSYKAIVVGAGGTGVAKKAGNNGGDSSFASIIAKGGGGGGVDGTAPSSGGSGGGGAGIGQSKDGGAGTAGQGNDGGAPNGWNTTYAAGGGGGANAVVTAGVGKNGTNYINNNNPGAGGAGGAGRSSSISGLLKLYAGGGGGGVWDWSYKKATAGAGGSGGGGAGSSLGAGIAGAINTGGGGGGSGKGYNGIGAPGGSGIVIVRYLTSALTLSDVALSADNSGNVGLGVSAPTAKLDVVGGIKASGPITALGVITATGLITANGGMTATRPITVNGGIKIPTGAGAGLILTSDGQGNATWQSCPK